MNPKIIVTEEFDVQQKILGLGLFDEDKFFYSDFNPELSAEIKGALSRKSFSLEFGKSFSTKISNSIYDRIIVVSLGKKSEFSLERVRRAISKLLKASMVSKHYSLTTNIADLSKEYFDVVDLGRAVGESAYLGTYSFDKYLPEDKKMNKQISLSIKLSGDSKVVSDFKKGLKEGEIIGRNTNFTRDIVNEPANVLTPSSLEAKAKGLFSRKKNVSVRVLNESALKKLGMNALLGVSSGGHDAPRVILIEYKNGKKSDKPIVFVGKGITFDSGGYNIKPTGYMEDMKCDMAGAGAVLGAISAIQELGLKINVVGVVPTCENLVSGSAFKPGDIIKTYSGKTVEIGNTDAEGRLILADALAYAVDKYSPKKIVDIATLTGASIVALGYYVAALMGTDNELVASLKYAGDLSYDRVWPLPFYEEYLDAMDGDISDLNNMSKKLDRAAGCITGGVFLSKFVKNTPWAHIDIGGSAYLKESKEYNPKYASGAGVRLLSYFVMNESK